MSASTSSSTLLAFILSAVFAFKELLPPADWAEKYIKLTKKQSNYSGSYSLKRTPYFRAIYEAVANPKVRKIHLQKSAQIGASQMFSNIAFYYACNFALPIGIIFPSQEMAKSFAERNLHNQIEHLEPIQELLTGDIDDIRRSELVLKTTTLKILGGGSATKLSSNPLALVLIDECDKYLALETSGEADPVELAEARTLSYQDNPLSKILCASTPTVEGSSKIEKLFLEGDQNHFHIACPHCGHEQSLRFEQLQFGHCKEGEQWDLNRVEKETSYTCEKCSGKIEEKEKFGLLNKGRWIAANPKAPDDTKSFQISALYSLSISWGKIARLFLQTKGDRSRLQNFYNSVLGLPFAQQQASIEESDLDALVKASPKYSRGQVPLFNGRKPLALIAGADTQQHDIPFIVFAIYSENEAAVIDYGYAASFPDWNHQLNKLYEIGEEQTGLYMAIQDAAGNRTSEVYDNCIANPRIIPCYGRTEKHRLFTPIRKSTAPYKDWNLTFLNVNDKHFTDLLLMQVFKGKGEKLYLPEDVTQEFKKQLTAVSIVERKKKNGQTEFEYKSKRENHYFDALKYSYALRYALLPELLEPAEEEAEEPAQPVAQPAQFYGGW